MAADSPHGAGVRGVRGRWRDWVYWVVDSELQREEPSGRMRDRGRRGAFVPVPRSGETSWSATPSRKSFGTSGDSAPPRPRSSRPNLPFEVTLKDRDAHGGWYDATGDYGKHLPICRSRPTSTPSSFLTAWGLLKTHELLQRRGDPPSASTALAPRRGAWRRRLPRAREGPGRFLLSLVSGPGPEKNPRTVASARTPVASHSRPLSPDGSVERRTCRSIS